MFRHPVFPAAASAAALLLLLSHPGLAVQGTSRGLRLWSQSVLPALLPFGILAFRGEERWSERMTQRIEKEFLPGGWLILLFAGSTAAFLQALSGY